MPLPKKSRMFETYQFQRMQKRGETNYNIYFRQAFFLLCHKRIIKNTNLCISWKRSFHFQDIKKIMCINKNYKLCLNYNWIC